MAGMEDDVTDPSTMALVMFCVGVLLVLSAPDLSLFGLIGSSPGVRPTQRDRPPERFLANDGRIGPRVSLHA